MIQGFSYKLIHPKSYRIDDTERVIFLTTFLIGGLVWFSGPGFYPGNNGMAPEFPQDFPPANCVRCHLCGAIFVSKEPLDQHIEKCAGKKEICSYCQKRYKDVRDLRRHLKSVHGVNM